MQEEIWNQDMPQFERHPKLREEMKKAGQEVIVNFLDDGKIVTAETLEGAYQRKNISNIKPTDSLVFIVEKDDGSKREVWHKTTDFSSRRQLKAVRDANGGTLEGARVKVTRIAVGDRTQANWKYENAGGKND